MNTENQSPGAQLAAMRRFTERTCEICGDKFRGRKTTTACPKHQALARKRKQLAKQKEEQTMSILKQIDIGHRYYDSRSGGSELTVIEIFNSTSSAPYILALYDNDEERVLVESELLFLKEI